MSKLGVVYEKSTGEIVGYVSVNQDADLALNFNPATQEMVELPIDHPSQYEQDKWEIRAGRLERKQNA